MDGEWRFDSSSVIVPAEIEFGENGIIDENGEFVSHFDWGIEEFKNLICERSTNSCNNMAKRVEAKSPLPSSILL